MKKYLLSLFVIYFFLSGCGKTSSNINSQYSLQAKIQTVSYSTNSVSTFILANQQGCVTNKSYNITNIGQINVDAFYLDCYIKHYTKNSDFSTTKVGTHKIYDGGLLLSSSSCNCDLVIGLVDNSIPSLFSNTVLQSTNIVNNITAITKLDSTAAYVRYEIKGNFSCNFKNTNNVTIPVVGQFDIPIKVDK